MRAISTLLGGGDEAAVAGKNKEAGGVEIDVDRTSWFEFMDAWFQRNPTRAAGFNMDEAFRAGDFAYPHAGFDALQLLAGVNGGVIGAEADLVVTRLEGR